MRAILVATGDSPGIAPLNERYPVPLLPLMDRPIIQHVIEHLARQGIQRFDLILSHFPEKIESFLGDGKRWGGRFTYHLARDPYRPYRILKTMSYEGDGGESILLGHADRLLQLPPYAAGTPAPILYCSRPEPNADSQWTGWALLTPAQLAAVPSDADEGQLQTHLFAVAGLARAELAPPLRMDSFSAILAAHRAILSKEFRDLLLGGYETDPGVWISRNVVLHPTARITPPVFLGENGQIGPGVHLGPFAVVGTDCVLDSHCTVTNSIIMPGSYIGEGLELEDVLVDKNRLINARFGGAVTISDNFILGSLQDGNVLGSLVRLCGRVLALVLLILLAPVLLLTALLVKLGRSGPVLHRRTVLKLPAPSEDSDHTYTLWSFSVDEDPDTGTQRPLRRGPGELLLRVLPGLVNIVKGDLGFVGVPPRGTDEIQRLSHDWRSLYLRAKGGLITEASVRYHAEPTEDELYAAEAYYSVTAGWYHDLTLLFLYVRGALFGFLRRGRLVVSEDVAPESVQATSSQ